MTAGRVAKIVFLDRDTLSPETVLRAPALPHDLITYDRTPASEIAARIADADIVITNKVPIRESSLETAANLKFVAIAATGHDIIDIPACKTRGITVSNIRNYAGNTVPEHVFALIFALRRSLISYRESVARGRWQENAQFCFFDHPIRDLAGSTLGIIGRGSLGRRVAGMGQALGMKVQFAGRKGAANAEAPYTDFDAVLRTSDVISLHLPLTAETRGLISDTEFKVMERRPLLINTARGGLVDETALARALRGGLIAGAGFDVASTEPPAPDNPLMGLLDMPNFILTPHVAWASAEAVQGLADQLIDNVDAFMRGAPRNVVSS